MRVLSRAVGAVLVLPPARADRDVAQHAARGPVPLAAAAKVPRLLHVVVVVVAELGLLAGASRARARSLGPRELGLAVRLELDLLLLLVRVLILAGLDLGVRIFPGAGLAGLVALAGVATGFTSRRVLAPAVLATGTLIALLAGLVALLLLVLAPVSAPGRAAKLLGRGCENRILRARTMAKWGWASVSRCNRLVIRCYRVE